MMSLRRTLIVSAGLLTLVALPFIVGTFASLTTASVTTLCPKAGIAGSECTDDNRKNGDGCSKTCKLEKGWLPPSDATEGGFVREIECGDEHITAKEMELGQYCDDNNTKNGDGCSKTCRVEEGFACTTPPAGWRGAWGGLWGRDCYKKTCGDGDFDARIEKCEDGDRKDGDGCSKTCTVEKGWTCSDGTDCFENTCGNGKRDYDIIEEQCDDGNVKNGDGCSETCTYEKGWTCTGIPMKCQKACGNGRLNEGELCDDGNRKSNDGCSITCKVEKGWVCNSIGGCRKK